MAKYNREATQRAIRAGYCPPIQCPTCGQRFWTEEARLAHRQTSTGNIGYYCQYAPAGPKP